MKLLKLPLAGILMLSVLAPLSFAVPIGAQFSVQTGQASGLHGRYEVLYRHDHHDSWRVYGTYHADREAHHADREAHHAADHLRHQSYQVRVHHHS